jgi:hypothetical protein
MKKIQKNFNEKNRKKFNGKKLEKKLEIFLKKFEKRI